MLGHCFQWSKIAPSDLGVVISHMLDALIRTASASAYLRICISLEEPEQLIQQLTPKVPKDFGKQDPRGRDSRNIAARDHTRAESFGRSTAGVRWRDKRILCGLHPSMYWQLSVNE